MKSNCDEGRKRSHRPLGGFPFADQLTEQIFAWAYKRRYAKFLIVLLRSGFLEWFYGLVCAISFDFNLLLQAAELLHK